MNILLVHGIFNSGAMFNRLVETLSRQGHRCFAPSLSPNDGRLGLIDLAHKLDDYVRQHIPADEEIVVIGFSMGCLVSRYYMQRLGGNARTKAYFAISGPHYGTLLGYGYIGQGARDMCPDSEFLRDLNALDAATHDFPIYTYWTPWDLMIVPATSSLWQPGIATQVPVLIHRFMVSDGTVCKDIAQKIQSLGSTGITTEN
jgi:triacylglycerol lipase